MRLDEYTKTASHNNRGTGLTTSLMAVVSTELKIASDFFQAVADFLGPKYEQGKSKAQEAAQKGEKLIEQGKENAQQYQAAAADKVEEFGKAGEQKAEEARKSGGEKIEQAKKEAQRAQAEAGKKAQK